MRTIQAFKRALLDMKDKGELEKILNYTSEDTDLVERDIELINELDQAGADAVSIWALLHELKSADILKNALCFMITYESEDTLEIDNGSESS